MNKNFSSLEKATQIKNKLNNNEDVIIRQINFLSHKICVLYIDSICNTEEINQNIISPLNNYCQKSNNKSHVKKDFLQTITNCLNVCELETKAQDVIEKILKGYVLIICQEQNIMLLANVIEYKERSVEEPPNSTVIAGPREGFTESIKTNLCLIRKRLVTTNLKIEGISLGNQTKTSIKIIYLKNVAQSKIVKLIKEKLNNIEIDGVIDSYYLCSFLEENPQSIFRQVGNCEKPDILCAKLLEGRVGIMVDGSPVVLTVPFVLIEDFQSSNDYYSEPHRATVLRVLRFFALVLSIYLPGMFIALQLYHYKVLPLKFLITIIDTTQNLPLNPFLEVLFIIVLFDILFEASIRMPRYLGIAVSIVGALILGDTAVKAGLVSPPGVMIVALSAINIYILPNQSSQISLLKTIFSLVGGFLGFHGLILATVLLVSFLASLQSFGAPYLAPYAPFVLSDQKDGLVKQSILNMKTTPKSFDNKSKIRLKVKTHE